MHARPWLWSASCRFAAAPCGLLNPPAHATPVRSRAAWTHVAQCAARLVRQARARRHAGAAGAAATGHVRLWLGRAAIGRLVCVASARVHLCG
eukprot:4180461-Prymnesium_polylepis.1